MWLHDLTMAVRSLRRERAYAVLNVVGLAVGLASVLLIGSYVRTERSYDRFHADADWLYRIDKQMPGNEFLGSDRFAMTPASLAPTLRDEVPTVEDATTVGQAMHLIGRAGTEAEALAEDGLWADDRFLSLFTFPLLHGDARTALAEPNSVVLTASLAQALFGSTDVVGQSVDLGTPFGDPSVATVTGVADDPPTASQLTFRYLVSIQDDENYRSSLDQWNNSSWFTYARLRPDATPEAVEAGLTDLIRAREGDGSDTSLHLTPITAAHLDPRANFAPGTIGDARVVTLFSVVAVVILLLACVNYTNLATARSARHAREVGLRKTVGASRASLVRRHLSESVLTALLALGLGVALAALALPRFEAWADRDLSFGALAGPWTIPVLLAATVGVGVLAGIYPALVLTAARPIDVLKGQRVAAGGLRRLSALLIVGQYVAAVVLIVGSLAVYRQMQFVRDATTGLDGEQIVTLRAPDVMFRGEMPAFIDALERVPGVVAASASSDLPIDVESSTTVTWEGQPEGGEEQTVYQAGVDGAFGQVYGLDVLAGRSFSPEFAADSLGALVLNATAARAFGWTPDEAVGKTVNFRNVDTPVVGVVSDFHMQSLHRPIEPLVMRYATSWSQYVSLRVRPDDLPATLAGAQSAWEEVSEYPFTYAFLDEAFATLYADDQRLGQGVGAFTLLALFIASMGLFGLAAFAAQQRRKEVGVRKVLGASVAQVARLLSRDYLRLVALALVIALPLAYVVARRWLEGFAYKADLDPVLFAVAAALALATALAAVSVQTWRAATADPVRALRSE